MEQADLVIVNTCSIREKPELKLHSFLGEARKIKRERQKDLQIAISGCVAQQEGQTLLSRYKDVDLVFGPDAVPNVQQLVKASQNNQILDTDFLASADYVFCGRHRSDAERHGRVCHYPKRAVTINVHFVLFLQPARSRGVSFFIRNRSRG